MIIISIISVANSQCGTCTITSGHSVTLDGGEHHYLGRGWVRIYQIDQFELQCLMGSCHGDKSERLSGHTLRNDERKICLQACRVRFAPTNEKCEMITSWEPNLLDSKGFVSVDVNGASVPVGKGHGVIKAGGNNTETAWTMRVERVGNDGVAIDILLSGRGVVVVRLGPSRIITLTVKDVEGGSGICGSCDGIRENDLAGALSLNISDIEGHDRFASQFIRGADNFNLIPARPICAGGTKIDEKGEVAELIKERTATNATLTSIRFRQAQLRSLGSAERLPGDPDTDPALILPPVAIFSNYSLLNQIQFECTAGMIVPVPGTTADTRMQFAIDNCVLEKSYGPGYETWATSSVLAFVYGLMIEEQTTTALDLFRQGSGAFCAMCVTDVQTFLLDTAPIREKLVKKRVQPGQADVVMYTPLDPVNVMTNPPIATDAFIVGDTITDLIAMTDAAHATPMQLPAM